MNNLDTIKLMAKLASIAALDGESLEKVMAQLERDFAEHVAVIRPLVYLAPDAVVEKLQREFPDIAEALSNPLAVKVVRKIQDYLIRKGKQNAD